MAKVQIDDFSNALIDELKEYKNVISIDLKAELKAQAKETAKELRKTSPVNEQGKRKGRYAKGWTVKEASSTSFKPNFIVHNKTDYQLTHLLENGHALVRGGRTLPTRASAKPHILKAEQNAIANTEKRIQKLIKEASTK